MLLVVGLLRVYYFEKGAAFYFGNAFFIAKLALFIVVGLLSIYPTLEFSAWRKALKQATQGWDDGHEKTAPYGPAERGQPSSSQVSVDSRGDVCPLSSASYAK